MDNLTPTLINAAIQALTAFLPKLDSKNRANVEILLKHIAFLESRVHALEFDKTSLKLEISALKRENLVLQRANSTLQREIHMLQRENIDLQTRNQEQIAALIKQNGHSDQQKQWRQTKEKYELDEKFGCLRSRETSHPYCTKCLAAEPPVETPLPDADETVSHLVCPVCHAEFPNPRFSTVAFNRRFRPFEGTPV